MNKLFQRSIVTKFSYYKQPDHFYGGQVCNIGKCSVINGVSFADRDG